MWIRSLEELQAVDEMSQHVTPWGLASGQMSEADTVRLHQEMVAFPEPGEAVPEATAGALGRARLTYAYGVLEYEMYTVASQLAQLTLELALRERFVDGLGGSLALNHATEPEFVESVKSFIDVAAVVGHGGSHRRGWRINQPGVDPKFRATLPELLCWARHNELLRGQRNRSIEKVLIEMRNDTAHPSGHWTSYPTEVARTIQHVAEFVNELWGVPTPGGRHYPGPITLTPRIYAWSARSTESMHVPTFLEDVSRFDGWSCAAVAVPDVEDPSEHWHPWFVHTSLPTVIMHGPATAAATAQWLWQHSPEPIAVDVIDRLFLLVAGSDDWPLRPETLSLAARGLTEATFHVIRADGPYEARALALQHDGVKHEPGAVDPGDRATHVVTGRWEEVQALVGVDGDAEPIPQFTPWP